jgi:hypothetical protein
MSLLSQASICITPNGYKEGKLYSVIPSDGSGDMSVTRATTATRVNSAGLVELVPYNLLQYSEDFTNAAWIKITTTLTSGQSDPFGGNNAYKWNSSAIGVTQLSQSFSTGADVCNISIYAKAGSTSILNIWIGSAVTFDLANGSVTSGTGTITSVGNGWYRCSTNRSSISLTNTLNPYFSAASTSDFIYIYGGQAVEGSTALPYQKTETRLNIPRLDYSNGTCPSLLVEPQKTNLLTYSSSFDNAAWPTFRSSVTANATISPDGNSNAEKLIQQSGANDAGGIYQSLSIANSTTYTYSFFAKAAGYNFCFARVSNSPSDFNAWFNLETGVVGSTIGGVISSSIVPYGNGWYRCSMTFTSVATSAQPHIYIANSNASDQTPGADGVKGIYAWGAQLEVGNYSTSYIPTTSASVTRNADVISKTGISSLIGQTEGTLFFDSYVTITGDSSSYAGILLNNGTSSNVIAVGYYQDGRIQAAVFVSGSLLVNIDLPSFGLTNGKHKFALAYKLNDYVFYVDGIEVGSDTSATVPATSVFNLSDLFGGANISHNAVALWKTRLTNDQLEALTGTGFNTYAEMASYYNYVLQ